jgi:signal transduction histidine kinase
MWEKIVLNLLSNALKFTFSGSIRVELRHVDDTVELTVADTGTGIPESELPRIFERFHRVEGAKSRTHEGRASASR